MPLLLLRTRFRRIGGSRNPEFGANGSRRASSLASASPASSKPKAHLFSFLLLLLNLQLHSLQQTLLSCVRSPRPVIGGPEVREKRQRADWFAFGRLFCVVAFPVRPSFPFAPFVASLLLQPSPPLPPSTDSEWSSRSRQHAGLTRDADAFRLSCAVARQPTPTPPEPTPSTLPFSPPSQPFQPCPPRHPKKPSSRPTSRPSRGAFASTPRLCFLRVAREMVVCCAAKREEQERTRSSCSLRRLLDERDSYEVYGRVLN